LTSDSVLLIKNIPYQKTSEFPFYTFLDNITRQRNDLRKMCSPQRITDVYSRVYRGHIGFWYPGSDITRWNLYQKLAVTRTFCFACQAWYRIDLEGHREKESEWIFWYFRGILTTQDAKKVSGIFIKLDIVICFHVETLERYFYVGNGRLINNL